MTNGDKFMEVFGGLYATELWAKPEDEFLEWLTSLYEPTEELHEWCDDCKEYDHDKHCCPRWNHVIKKTLDELKANWQTAKVNNADDPYGLGMYGDCSECGAMVNENYAFCPNCGARLEWE